MVVPAVQSLRPATDKDRSQLANLLHFETHVHRHLDWRRPLDWLGQQPYYVAMSAGRVAAALACPPDPPKISWLRLFAVATRMEPETAWEALWPEAREALDGLAEEVVAIPLNGWFQNLLAASEFEHTHNVTVLDWRPEYGDIPAGNQEAEGAIRVMTEEDVAAVTAVDHTGFPPLWQYSEATIALALKKAAVATVVEMEGKVVAYQISSAGSQGLHLARLAVHPDQQGKRLALTMVADLQKRISKKSGQRLTVNTQDKNKPSLGLYDRAGFRSTGESFPVYQLQIP
jgi:ribosomal protein S18 acetylase RimI-like enzyme